jgi:WD40 repeat protein
VYGDGEDDDGDFMEGYDDESEQRGGNSICAQRDYRLQIIHRIPQLQALDGVVITASERARAQDLYVSGPYEELPYGQSVKAVTAVSAVSALRMREMGMFAATGGGPRRRPVKRASPRTLARKLAKVAAGSTSPVTVAGAPVSGSQQVSAASAAAAAPAFADDASTASTEGIASYDTTPPKNRRPAGMGLTPPDSDSKSPLSVPEGVSGFNMITEEAMEGAMEGVSDSPPQNYRAGTAQHARPTRGNHGSVFARDWYCRHVLTSTQHCQPLITLVASKSVRPRQFEYNSVSPEYMAVGTVKGEVIVLSHNTSTVVGHVRPGSSGAGSNAGGQHYRSSVLGLSWLHGKGGSSSKFISGMDNGDIHLYDLEDMRGWNYASGAGGAASGPPSCKDYPAFAQLTSVHVNADDSQFIASGYSPHVSLYDMCTGKVVNNFANLHSKHINVVKFANHDPNLFATSSFDCSVKLWDVRTQLDKTGPVFSRSSDAGVVMCCFSPDDRFLLSSAVDNEVRQINTVDGSMHTLFDIPKKMSKHNYTRSYYMSDGRYIITGSCEENVVKIYNSTTGNFLRDVELDPKNDSSLCKYRRPCPLPG